MTDPQDLTARLVRCPSVTPEEGGALVLLEGLLSEAGFACTRVDRGGVANLFARWGDKGHALTFGFNGHTDVVPVGDAAAWTHPPFGAEEEDGWLYGRGATDMKSGVAAFVAAAVDFVAETPPDGALVLAITGDEEGVSTDGTLALLDWMDREGERMSACIVGEPTSVEIIGDMVKIGRRGSMSAWVTVTGKQGHSAYLHKALNPLPAVALLAHRLSTHVLDEGTAHFDPSTCSVTSIDTGNPATNVIPAQARMAVNLRFNDLHSGDSLTDWLQAEADRVAAETGVTIDMAVKISGEAFLTPPGRAVGSCRGRGHGRNRGGPEAVHHRWHFGCAICQIALPGGGVRPCRASHAPGGRACLDPGYPRAEARLCAHPQGLLRRMIRRPTVVVMVKVPRPGRVKTRLARGIGAVPAAWWYRHQVARLLRRLRDPRWRLVLAVSPDAEALTSRVWPGDLPRVAQGGGDLGARMARLLSLRGPVIVIGSDIPGVTRAHLAQAFCGLARHDAVLGPAPDGGYWLIGLGPRPAPPGFLRGVRWSGPHALADSLATLRARRVGLADTLGDVDSVEDLARTISA